jgi:hypothetical protein
MCDETSGSDIPGANIHTPTATAARVTSIEARTTTRSELLKAASLPAIYEAPDSMGVGAGVWTGAGG